MGTRITRFLPATLLLLAGTAFAVDWPTLKAGMWEMKTHMNQAEVQAVPPSIMCLDASVQKEMMEMSQGMQKSMCSSNDMRREGSKIIGTAKCKISGSNMMSQSITTFDGDAAYHTDVRATYDPPLSGMKESTSTIDAKYLGPCKAGMKPGDMSVNGQTINIRQMRGAAGKP